MEVRSARLRSLAKVNLDLRVLYKRPDGYHELRTVFQTISLSDTLRVSYTPGRRTSIEIRGNLTIPGNLIETAAEAIVKISRAKGLIQFDFEKVIPMGGGLGGGSSNAAAVLLALPVLLGRAIPLVKLEEIASSLGSDVSFFLYGGTALGFGRGSELYPLPQLPTRKGLLVAPGILVSTPDAFRALNRSASVVPPPADFASMVWGLGSGFIENSANDFESVIYKNHSKLRLIHRRLEKSGAAFVRMSGSGSSIFAFFDRKAPDPSILDEYTVHRIETVSRSQYRKIWRQQLREHIRPGEIWPPHSRYAQ